MIDEHPEVVYRKASPRLGLPEENLNRGCVRGYDNPHVGEHSHEGNVLQTLVEGAVEVVREARVGRDELDVQVVPRDGVPYLLPPLMRNEAKAEARGIFPAIAKPAAIDTMSCSLIPT